MVINIVKRLLNDIFNVLNLAHPKNEENNMV